jgi:hypothetical protein
MSGTPVDQDASPVTGGIPNCSLVDNFDGASYEFLNKCNLFVPSAAISIQAAFDSFFMNSFPATGFPDEPTDSPNEQLTGMVAQCTSMLELSLRSIAFLFAFIVAFLSLQRRNDTFRDFFKNLLFILLWLFSISVYPMTCWFNSEGTLTSNQNLIVQFIKFFCTIFGSIFSCYNPMKIIHSTDPTDPPRNPNSTDTSQP